MKFDRVLHVRGSRMDFYSFEYFVKLAERIDLSDGKFYGYGKDYSKYQKTVTYDTTGEPTDPVVVDLSEYMFKFPDIWTSGYAADTDVTVIDKPLVPPCNVVTDTGVMTYDTSYMDYWLGYYNGCTPNIIAPANDPDAVISESTVDYVNFRGTIKIIEPTGGYSNDTPISKFTSDGTAYYRFDTNNASRYTELTFGTMSLYLNKVDPEQTGVTGEYAVKSDVQVYVISGTAGAIFFEFKRGIVNVENTLPIINGFCCFPYAFQGKLKATGSLDYLVAPTDRDRGMILVDFTQVGGCSFKPLDTASTEGTLKEFILPSSITKNYDETKQSMLFVIDGRLLKPSQYTKLDNHVLVNQDLTLLTSELDRKLCAGEHVTSNSRIVTCDGSRDKLRQTNSFVIIVNKPNLQVVEHQPWFLSQESTLEHGVNSYSALDNNQFPSAARGLLFDNTTRSVHHYIREEHTSTFYAEDEQQEETKYKTSTVRVRSERPLVILAGSLDNLMSAKAMMFDIPNKFAHDDQVMWPRWTILDLIFRG